mmetsp:Transcript_839/g.2544  ORF Transcript_839/g.2544 Transcript_839/m.2544 type:complete len:332 (-) Transcript_839:2997-3992(-)
MTIVPPGVSFTKPSSSTTSTGRTVLGVRTVDPVPLPLVRDMAAARRIRSSRVCRATQNAPSAHSTTTPTTMPTMSPIGGPSSSVGSGSSLAFPPVAGASVDSDVVSVFELPLSSVLPVAGVLVLSAVVDASVEPAVDVVAGEGVVATKPEQSVTTVVDSMARSARCSAVSEVAGPSYAQASSVAALWTEKVTLAQRSGADEACRFSTGGTTKTTLTSDILVTSNCKVNASRCAKRFQSNVAWFCRTNMFMVTDSSSSNEHTPGFVQTVCPGQAPYSAAAEQVGRSNGSRVGCGVGAAVGCRVGLSVGGPVGSGVGSAVGSGVGSTVGLSVG